MGTGVVREIMQLHRDYSRAHRVWSVDWDSIATVNAWRGPRAGATAVRKQMTGARECRVKMADWDKEASSSELLLRRFGERRHPFIIKLRGNKCGRK